MKYEPPACILFEHPIPSSPSSLDCVGHVNCRGLEIVGTQIIGDRGSEEAKARFRPATESNDWELEVVDSK
jgi:hypothetical protein